MCVCRAGMFGRHCDKEATSGNATVVIDFGKSPLQESEMDVLDASRGLCFRDIHSGWLWSHRWC